MEVRFGTNNCSILFMFLSAAFEWLGAKLVRCLTGKSEEGEREKEPAKGTKSAACRRAQRRREREEDLAYREVQTYDYEQYG